MQLSDRQLGMDQDISRRDFLGGVSVAIGATLLPDAVSAQDVGAQDVPGYYPPELTGMRGSHPGAFEAAHLARDGVKFEGDASDEQYDLVVVGAGISGLAAAYFFRKSFRQANGRDPKILILDNHDDFGGHAKRNEFHIDGQNIIGYGGTMFLEAPGAYPKIARDLIAEIGIDIERFNQNFNQDLYSSLGLTRGHFFDRETFGFDHLSVGDLVSPSVLEHSPLSPRARADLVRLYKNERHYLHDMPAEKRAAYLASIDYQTYLRENAGISAEALSFVFSSARNVWAVNTDAYPADAAWRGGYPGFGNLKSGIQSDAQEGDHRESMNVHFPDGNATVARMLVRRMIPAVAAGDSMEDIVTARFDYSHLDQPQSAVRVRLSSTVVRAQHADDDLTNPVTVTYVRDGRARNIAAQQVVMACYNAIIPRLCPEMSAGQKFALANCVRAPLVYTNVLIRNWRSFVKLGIHRAYCPGSYHHSVALDYPVSMGGYNFSKSPDEPIVLHLTRVPGAKGLSANEQFTAGKRDLLATSFEIFERNIREQLSRMLSKGGFDAARDIAAITVNRWPHGYAYGYDPETDQVA